LSARDTFDRALRDVAPDPAGRRWIWVADDQLTDAVGPLCREDPAKTGIVLVESEARLRRRPYHRRRLALVLANQRHFALEQARRGVAVAYRRGAEAEVLREHAGKHGAIRAMRPAERELRVEVEPLVADDVLELVPHEGWLTTRERFREAFRGKKTWRMDGFYRHVRRVTGILMEDGSFEGGKLSFDAENRRPWSGEPPAAVPPSFPLDPVKEEVLAEVESSFADHPGELDPDDLPATRGDAERLWTWAKEECLPRFGPFEDAMSTRSTTLFHTRISALLNLHRLLPARVVAEAAALDAPIASREGFVRQILGWREFVRHVHEETDGFRRQAPEGGGPGDGGWSRWSGRRWSGGHGGDAGAAPSELGAHESLPPAFWGTPSGMACLDRVVADVWREGYGHHITRLMVLGNLATLLGVEPREITDWFWAAYADAWDWVVEPNVLGMATFALGPLFTTKPYVSGAAYLDRMSDYCEGCAFHPKRTCPITPLYWAFLARNGEGLAKNPRLRMIYATLKKRPSVNRERDAAVHAWVVRALAAGEALRPEDAPD
jgi:deoxyribodipyrimidine photolyase-related protein